MKPYKKHSRKVDNIWKKNEKLYTKKQTEEKNLKIVF